MIHAVADWLEKTFATSTPLPAELKPAKIDRIMPLKDFDDPAAQDNPDDVQMLKDLFVLLRAGSFSDA